MDNRNMIRNLLKKLSEELKKEFNIINHSIGLNWNRDIDLSGIEDRLIAAIEKGETEQISLILDQGVANEMMKAIKSIKPIMLKTYGEKLQSVINEMIAKSKDTDMRYADMISKIKDSPANDFRTSLQDINGSTELPQIPIEETLDINAEIYYKRTGEIPNGYVLGEDGKLVRDGSTRIAGESKSEKDSQLSK